MGIFEKIKIGMKKTRDNIFSKFDNIINSFTKLDEGLLEEFEDLLIMGDVGIITAKKICNLLKSKVKSEGIKDSHGVKEALKKIIIEILEGETNLKINSVPSIILVIGVNGVGKTTAIGKLAAKFTSQGKKVVLAAADTFRAAAIDQLEIWADRAKCQIVKHAEGSDPAAVIFDAISSAKSRNADVIICDTAGRLHNKSNLISELDKINKVINRELADNDKESLLVLDATTGQNAIIQAKEFQKVVDLTGIVLTKLDGTAKGGIVISIKDQLNIPIKYIGVGEDIDSLQKFDAISFTNALFEGDDN